MALEATHIRFAIDVKDKFKIADIAAYIRGTIYPDSRYVSGIRRELTHGNEFLKKEFANTDFKRGWQIHLLCDKIQRQIFRQNIPGFDRFNHEGYEENQWINFTAAKIIADTDDVQSFDIQSVLKYLDSELCPNNEDVSSIDKYNEIMIDLYGDKKVPSTDDYMKMWSKFGIDDELGKKVSDKINQLMSNKYQEIIKACYDKMLQSFDKFYQRVI